MQSTPSPSAGRVAQLGEAVAKLGWGAKPARTPLLLLILPRFTRKGYRRTAVEGAAPRTAPAPPPFRTRCEDPKTIADLNESTKALEFNDGGGRAFALASSVKITKSRTIKATATMLVCQLTMRTIETGEPNMYNARHTIWLEKDGQWRTLFQPNY